METKEKDKIIVLANLFFEFIKENKEEIVKILEKEYEKFNNKKNKEK